MPDRENFHKHFLRLFILSFPLFAVPVGSQAFRRTSQRSQGSQAQGIVPFSHANPGSIAHQVAMKISGSQKPERLKEQPLTGGAHEQISPAHRLGYLHGRIIHHAGQLISGKIVLPPDHKIAKIFARRELLLPIIGILKGNDFSIRNAKTPTKFWRRLGGFWPLPAGAGINEFITLLLVRSAQRLLDVFSGTGTRVDKSARPKFLKRRAIHGQPLALIIGTKITANVRAFTPLKSKPAQIFEHGGFKPRSDATRIQILISENQATARILGAGLSNPECSSMAQMQIPRRRRRQSATIAKNRFGVGRIGQHGRIHVGEVTNNWMAEQRFSEEFLVTGRIG